MKKILLVTLVVIAVILTGCQKKEPKMNVTTKSTIEATADRSVTIETSDKTLTGTSVTIILKNNSDKEITYDDSFEIEMEQEDGWYKLKNSMDFPAKSYTLKPNEEKELKLDWKEGYGVLLNGTYRIVKKVNHKIDDKEEAFYVEVIFGIVASY